MYSAVPDYRDDYNKNLQETGKYLYDNREKILKGENPMAKEDESTTE
ncbi:MAG: hypothetical protein WD077_02370 [Bacteroidia bacterium]